MHTSPVSPAARGRRPARYAALHRTIESGHATDVTHADLARVCMSLGKAHEARCSVQRISDLRLRRQLERDLISRGMMEHTDSSYDVVVHRVSHEEMRSTIGEQVAEATRYLFTDHMPLSGIALTLAYPLLGCVLGLGYATPLVMLLPALVCAAVLFAVTGSIGMEVLHDAARGVQDPFLAPTPGQLRRWAVGFARGPARLFAVFGLPLFTLGLLAPPWWLLLPAVALFVVWFPTALLLYGARGRIRAAAPRHLLRVLRRGGREYAEVHGALVALMSPALVAWWLSLSGPLYVQLMLVGPLAVTPFLLAMRVLGSYLHEHPDALRRAPRRSRPAPVAVRPGRSRRAGAAAATSRGAGRPRTA